MDVIEGGVVKIERSLESTNPLNPAQIGRLLRQSADEAHPGATPKG